MNTENSSTPRYADLLKQIEQLKEEAEKIRLHEMEAVISDLRNKIEIYGISAKELGFSESKTSGQRKAPKKAKTDLPPKHISSDGSQTWHGKGKRPQWVIDELASGKTLEDLLIATKQPPSTTDDLK
jgi:DNA-binding protein H-NS